MPDSDHTYNFGHCLQKHILKENGGDYAQCYVSAQQIPAQPMESWALDLS